MTILTGFSVFCSFRRNTIFNGLIYYFKLSNHFTFFFFGNSSYECFRNT